MHLHVGIAQLLVTFIGVIFLGGLYRAIALLLNDKFPSISQAMMFLY